MSDGPTDESSEVEGEGDETSADATPSSSPAATGDPHAPDSNRETPGPGRRSAGETDPANAGRDQSDEDPEDQASESAADVKRAGRRVTRRTTYRHHDTEEIEETIEEDFDPPLAYQAPAYEHPAPVG